MHRATNDVGLEVCGPTVPHLVAVEAGKQHRSSEQGPGAVEDDVRAIARATGEERRHDARLSTPR